MKVGDEELDALRELMNIGVGRAAAALNDMIGRVVRLNVPSVSLIEPDKAGAVVSSEHGRRLACVRLRFEGSVHGSAHLIFPSEGGSKLVAMLTGEEPGAPDLDSLRAGTLTEVGNILLNGLMGSITSVVQGRIGYGLPVYIEHSAENLQRALCAESDSVLLLARTQFFLCKGQAEVGGERVDGKITLLLGFDSLAHLIERVQQMGEEALA